MPDAVSTTSIEIGSSGSVVMYVRLAHQEEREI
jgi:hypothetical protein